MYKALVYMLKISLVRQVTKAAPAGLRVARSRQSTESDTTQSNNSPSVTARRALEDRAVALKQVRALEDRVRNLEATNQGKISKYFQNRVRRMETKCCFFPSVPIKIWFHMLFETTY